MRSHQIIKKFSHKVFICMFSICAIQLVTLFCDFYSRDKNETAKFDAKKSKKFKLHFEIFLSKQNYTTLNDSHNIVKTFPLQAFENDFSVTLYFRMLKFFLKLSKFLKSSIVLRGIPKISKGVFSFHLLQGFKIYCEIS